MKKLLALCAVPCILLTAACGGGEQPTETPSNSESSQTATETPSQSPSEMPEMTEGDPTKPQQPDGIVYFSMAGHDSSLNLYSWDPDSDKEITVASYDPPTDVRIQRPHDMYHFSPDFSKIGAYTSTVDADQVGYVNTQGEFTNLSEIVDKAIGLDSKSFKDRNTDRNVFFTYQGEVGFRRTPEQVVYYVNVETGKYTRREVLQNVDNHVEMSRVWNENTFEWENRVWSIGGFKPVKVDPTTATMCNRDSAIQEQANKVCLGSLGASLGQHGYKGLYIYPAAPLFVDESGNKYADWEEPVYEEMNDETTIVKSGNKLISNPLISPDGKRVFFQARDTAVVGCDWYIVEAVADGKSKQGRGKSMTCDSTYLKWVPAPEETKP